MENNYTLPKSIEQAKYIILNGPESIQGSQEWKDFRHLKIGASMAPTIMGENPYQTPLQLFEQTLCGEEVFVNESMIRGNTLEPKARDWFNNLMNIDMEPVVIQSMEYPWLIASLDGYHVNIFDKPEIIEIKCGEKTFAEIAMGECPKQYYGQLQHQMMITGLSEAFLCAFDGEVGTSTTVFRDQEYIYRLFEAEKDFHQRLLDFNPPDPSNNDYINIDDPFLEIDVQDYKDLCEQIEILEKAKQALKNRLINIVSAGKEGRRYRIGKAKLCKITRPGSVQYDKIEELKAVDLNQYRKPPTEFWSIK